MRASPTAMSARAGASPPARRSPRLAASAARPAASPPTSPRAAPKVGALRLRRSAAPSRRRPASRASGDESVPAAAVAPPLSSNDDDDARVESSPSFGSFSPPAVKRMQTRTLALMFFTYLSIYFARKPLSVVKAPMQDVLGLSTGAIAGIDSAFLGLYALGQLVLPSLGDRLGAKKMLVVGYALSVVSVASFAFATSPGPLAFAWGVNGVAQSLAYPLHVKVLSPWFSPTQRGTAMGLWATSQQVGGVLSTALAAFLLGVAGWRFAVVGPAALTCVAAVALTRIVVDPPWCKLEAKVVTKGKGADADANEGVVGDCDWRPPVGMREVLRIPKLAALMASYFFVKIVRYCLIFWLPFYLARECGMGVAAAGYMSCLFDLGGVAGGIATGVLGDKYFPGRRTVLGAYMCAALALAVLFYQSASQMNALVNGLVMTLIGVLVAGPDALLGSSSIADTCEAAGYGAEVLGTASGLVNGAGSVGAVLQGALTAWIASTYGWGALFGTLAVMCVLSVGTLLASVPETPEKRVRTAAAA